MITDPSAIEPGTIPCIRTFRSAFGCRGCSGRHAIGGRPAAMCELVLQSYAIGLIGHYGLECLHIPDSVQLQVRGYPDLTIWRGKRVLWRELKRQGETWSQAQRIVAADLAASGADVSLWCPRDLYSGLIERQLMREAVT